MNGKVQADDPYHCDHTETELRRRTHSNNTVHFVVQCLRCGTALRNYAKTSQEVHKAYARRGQIPDFDENLKEEFYKQVRREHTTKRETERAEWFVWYNDYLCSEEWYEKRQAVLKRDGYLCRGCRRRPATEVHHLSYEHVGDEYLFELISLCTECHGQLTEDRRNGRNATGGIAIPLRGLMCHSSS